MTRAVFLYLAHNRKLRRWMESSHLSKRLTQRFIPGETLDDLLVTAQRLADGRFLTTADRLGENVNTEREANQALDASLQALDRIAALNIGATFSIKLTQFGLDLSTDLCLANVRRLVERAKGHGSRIEIDMESTAYSDRTLEVVRSLHREYGAVRAVIQAYLYRTADDIAALSREGVPIRLCKGAYNEPPEVAFASKAEVDANYVAQSRVLLERGAYPAFATHDPKMIAAILDELRKRGTTADQFEFQMLYGIRRDLQEQLVAQGYRVRLYVPYGDAWYPYFMRRLAERPANVFFILRNLLRR